jgi:hypothetical protein
VLAFKNAELLAYSNGSAEPKDVNSMVTDLFNLTFPWQDISEKDTQTDLIDMLKENY